MSWRYMSFCKEALFVAATLLLIVPSVPAGEHVRAADQPTTGSQPAPTRIAPAAPLPQAISVVVSIPQRPATAPVYVDIRGPDGQVRRFPVEGGRAAIQYRQVILHPGEMLTIRWAPAK
jgi:hypothetical protein